jgi:hypothetical protein
VTRPVWDSCVDPAQAQSGSGPEYEVYGGGGRSSFGVIIILLAQREKGGREKESD